MEHIVIIGNGISGVSAARHIRKLSNKKITIISAETDYFFSRTALMYVYMGHMKFEHTQPYENWFWEKNRIDLVKGYVTSIDHKNSILKIKNSADIVYDKLIIATGSKPNKFGWPGQDLGGVQGLYSKQDLDTLEKNAPNKEACKRAVIVGGGLIGIEMAEKINNLKMLSIINENIAGLYASQKDYKQALEFYKKVKRINTKIGNEVFMAETMSNMASVYADMNELEYAMYNVNASISVFEKNEITDWLAFAYEVKGKTYLKEDKFKWALYWYRQSEVLHDKLQDERGQIDLYNGMAEAYLGQEKDSISKNYALKAYEISRKLNFKEGTQKCANTLYRISKINKDYDTALTYHELYTKLSDTLSRNENKKSLTMLKTKLKYDQQKEDLIIANEKALAKQKNYVYASLGILTIFLIVTFLVRRNEHLQKKLNIELKANQEELERSEYKLRELNDTKDKLFSIIGHDLRGPIGAFQGLLKLYKDGEVNQKEFLSFIPKLGADLDHISFTLNNLLSWGQSQMNGAVTKPTVISLDNLVTDNIKLLSEIATKKSIKVVSRLSENTLAWSDGDQIDIVIRNLMSNALKFTPENGMITVGAAEKNNHWEIFVRDTGVGMDRETQEKVFAENSSHTTYGTNNEKGTGLGLSLCKEMVEKNNGAIWVDSIPRKGSCFYFTLPKAKKEYQKTA